ncbi:sensory rhodopsin transducer [Streptomyces cuspidosporus]|uniref:Sensory rhodopsin transducer n=1 Tax=Streptomyces cuspidosporus TaxID=66882 RepID=A0ABP5S9R0_9ACTN
MTTPAIGTTTWVVADGYIPPGSTGPAPAMTSHDSICMLNAGSDPAHVTIEVFYTDREPVGPYELTVPARRAHHQRINDLRGPEPILPGIDYCLVIRSDRPLVVQHTRLDSRQAENALMSTIAYPASL